MKIGIIGSGIVGQVLAKAFFTEGHSVILGTRNPGKPELKTFREANPEIQVASFSDAARSSALLVLATGGAVTEEAIRLAGVENFSGKVVIDTTNPIAPSAPVNGVLSFFTQPGESLMERIQLLLPDASLVKAFNSVGNAFMYKPVFAGGPPTMFICGNNEEAKAAVINILTSFGWETEDMGKAEAARAIEPLCILWCIPGFTRNQWTHAFKLLKN